jgi:hypothetical protein
MAFTLQLPSPNGESGKTEEIGLEGNSLVIVGANGSGKSRLGYWIEDKGPHGIVIHRISAQRILTMPNRLNFQAVQNAHARVLMGDTGSNRQMKFSRRWSHQPTTGELNDFEAVLELLFAMTIERDHDYVEESKRSNVKLVIPPSPSENLQEIWDQLLPNRQLTFDFNNAQVEALLSGVGTYPGRDMSDGERVALYLMAQCLCVDADVFIIDEPEIHLHRAILTPLWNKLEALKRETLFIYITHDLDFAASRTNAKKIWVKEYRKQGREEKWQWEEIPATEALPQNILLTLLGNPRPVLFVEGMKGGLDYAIYQEIYREWLVIPRESCEAVIHSVKALKKFKEFPSFHVQVYGIIDRDFRNDDEVQRLEKDGIFSTPTTEIENLLCTIEVLEEVAKGLGRTREEIDDLSRKAADEVFSLTKTNFEKQVSKHTVARLRATIEQRINTKIEARSELLLAMQEFRNSMNEGELYDWNAARLQRDLDNRDYERILQFYDGKELVAVVSRLIGRTKDDYIDLVKRYLVKPETKEGMLKALQKYMPKLPLEEEQHSP